jgi:hypothetical protein
MAEESGRIDVSSRVWRIVVDPVGSANRRDPRSRPESRPRGERATFPFAAILL